MAENEDPRVTIETALNAWPDLAPNPEAMDQVTALMMVGMADSQPTAAAAAAEPVAGAAAAASAAAAAAAGESQFRLLSYIWAAVALGIYLAWDLLTRWLQVHPAWMALMIAFACVSLLAPLLLLPMLRGTDEGGTPC